MSALTFDKSELGNLEYSLQREMLATDRIGGYMSTTIVCCNTRRYHGLMVAPIDDSDRTYVLLSALDETIIQHDQTFNLALHRFQGTYEPRGHKYITDFEYTPTPTITYRVGGVILKKEMLWIHKRTQLMIRYTLVDAHSETRLRLRPFLAFRDKHALTHANMEADGHSYPAVNGVKCRLYGSFPWLYLQTSKPGAEFVPAPDWYYNFEYRQDIARGYDGYEDLMTTGYFETELKKGESIIFSASLDEMGSTKTIEEVFGGSVPKNFYPAVEKGIQEAVQKGPLAGYPMVGLKATLYDGSYHPVDSNEMAFKLAAILAFKEAMPNANPTLLEPIGALTVTVPDSYVGDVMGDLSKRRGRPMGMSPDHEGNTVIEAEVPMAEMSSYAIDLRAMTQARGSFTLEFVRYEEVPKANQAKIIADAKAND